MQTDKSFCDIDEGQVDQSAWVPKGGEVVPKISLANGHVHSQGKRFISSDVPLLDYLLCKGLIEDSHHASAYRIIRLFRAGTTKYNYSRVKIFDVAHGQDNSKFCPMTVFLRITRGLKATHLQWIRVLCGINNCTFIHAANNADLIKEALEATDRNYRNLPREETEESSDDD